jgi:hypothetical protein
VGVYKPAEEEEDVMIMILMVIIACLERRSECMPQLSRFLRIPIVLGSTQEHDVVGGIRSGTGENESSQSVL